MRHALRYMTVSLLVVSSLQVGGFGAFTGGMESFDGTVVDTAEWEITGPGSVSQDDRLTIGIDGWTDATALSQRVAVGQSVRVEVRLEQPDLPYGKFELIATNNSAGADDTVHRDTRFLAASFSQGWRQVTAHFRNWGGDEGSVLMGGWCDVPPELDSFILEMQRVTDTSDHYTVYRLGAAPLGAFDCMHESIAEALYVALYAEDAAYSVDNIVVIPEPGSAGILCIAGLRLLSSRRGSQSRQRRASNAPVFDSHVPSCATPRR